mgnify:FL=1
MKITFNNNTQKVTAEKIIRCEVGRNIFHIAVYNDEVVVYTPSDAIKCYEVDCVDIREKENG